MDKYQDRYEAGKILAKELAEYKDNKDVIILALPRGGVPVAYEIAQALHTPMDLFIVRKLGVPYHEELAMGAIATGGAVYFNEDVLRSARVTQQEIDRVTEKEKIELERRNKVYRGDRPFPDLNKKIVILVDDGIATGATMRAAVKALRQKKPAKIIIAVPVAEKSTCESMQDIVNDVVCPMKPTQFYAVGNWYENFNQTEDEEVHQLLTKMKVA